MFEKAALHITEWMENNKIIEPDRMVVVKWGIRNILDTLFNLATFLTIGILMHMPIETIVFTLGYIPLRSYAGGYHAKTPFRCWILSNFILLLALLCVHYLSRCPFILWTLAILSIVILIILMPVSDIHKPLSDVDKHRYKRKGVYILLFEIIVSVLFSIINLQAITYSIFLVLIILFVMLVLGKIKNKVCQK